MALTTTSTLAIREEQDATAAQVFRSPIIQTIAQINSDSEQIVLTIAFLNTSGVIQAAQNVSVMVSDLQRYDEDATVAYKTIINALEQYAKAAIEAIPDNDGKGITYTART
jgi:ABC-type antimicrobial peptide transport system ATPase subunit